ncbi:MAG TPA: hypothetical protein PKA05_08265, partial [Roseiflexaceae bacterium]|nr:hypothetical protein [Roseiflexaceae bacterium]
MKGSTLRPNVSRRRMLRLMAAACGLVGCGGEPPRAEPPARPSLVVALPLIAAAPAQPGDPPTATSRAQPAAPSASATRVPPTATAQPTDTATPTASATIAPTSTPTSTATPRSGPGGLRYPLVMAELEYGVAAHLFYIERRLPLQRAVAAGFGWIRQQIHWRDIEGPRGRYSFTELDGIVAAVQAAGLKLLLSVVRSPRFATRNGNGGMPDDPALLAAFVAELTRHYRGRVHAIEIWNEQNLAHENGGRVVLSDAGHYVELLSAAYSSIKAVDPTVFVLAGAPSSTGITDATLAIDDMAYYEAMYSYRQGMLRDCFDAQAVHPGSAANPPDTLWPVNPSQAEGWTEHPTFYFRHVENVRALMQRHGIGDHQIWITEFGWATRNTTPGFEFGNQVSFEQQAAYLVGALRRTREQYPWVGAAFVWNLNFAMLRARSGQPLHEQASYALLNADGSPRPAYQAISDLL